MNKKLIIRIILSTILAMTIIVTLTGNDRDDNTIYLCNNIYEI